MAIRFRFAALIGVTVVAMAWPGCSCGSDDTASKSDGDQPPPGVPGIDVVSAGTLARSESYQMVFTVGQSTQNQGKTTSQGYRMQGGLVGAIGSKP